MNQNQTQSPKRPRPKRKNRGATVAAVLCFVAAIAIVGTYTFKDYKAMKNEQLLAKQEEAKAEKEKEAEPLKETTTDLIINDLQEKVKETNQENADQKQEDSVENGQADAQSAQTSQTASGKTKTVSFNSDSKLLWPVNGNILMSYSMDKTVYFSTLDQYKYNPALVIAGAEGDQVISAAPGIVKSIDQSAETGLTVNVDIGNGYELFYGQLKEVLVKVGDQVEAKTIIGYVSAPTKYYSVEGSNVYFEMRKDGQPVNPMEYLVE